MCDVIDYTLDLNGARGQVTLALHCYLACRVNIRPCAISAIHVSASALLEGKDARAVLARLAAIMAETGE